MMKMTWRSVIDVAGFFSGVGSKRPPRMLKFFSGGKVGSPGGKSDF